jgi:hypothetical protein
MAARAAAASLEGLDDDHVPAAAGARWPDIDRLLIRVGIVEDIPPPL